MKVSITGWRRNTDSVARLVDRRIEPTHVGGKAIRYLNEMQVKRYTLTTLEDLEDGSSEQFDQSGVRVTTGVTIRTSGDFSLTIHFTTREIVLLAIEAMKNWTFDKFVRTFARFQSELPGEKKSGDTSA